MLEIDRYVVSMVGNLEVTGTVPAELLGRPLVMAANHIGTFDALVLMKACWEIGIAPRFMLAGGLLDAPVLGWALTRSGHLRVERGKATVIESFATAVESVKSSDTPLLVYPEGRISRDPGLWPERGKTGVARIALAANAPVIPISQWGAHEAIHWGNESVNGLPDLKPYVTSFLSALRRRPRFKVHFGSPVDLSDLSAGKAGDAVRAHKRIMQAVTDNLATLRRDEPDLPKYHDPTRPTDTRSPWR
ncbi:1-acyl-sn-glycerol-3-phosphate acyltransferase [Actinocrispum wychmicini]|uniref:1-acyl-sn-glycerol-3-phosphate acyltransferase n=2 Tax=Actinocrispum wychmicini TaxID=1213861 RepID=A0A4R2JJL6_9PSEU|nr:1-acyl-sn-glycerol-3-phosphate acyltransferase [Actinocrispum wychmicini]